MNIILRNTILVLAALLLTIQADAQKRKIKKAKAVKTKTVKQAAAPMIMYVESYGSVCCPKDPKWTKEFFPDYVKRFNTEHKVTIKEVYNQAQGREGEQVFAVTLKELSPALKKKFIEDRIRITDEDAERKQQAIQLMNHPKPVSEFIQGDITPLKIDLQ